MSIWRSTRSVYARYRRDEVFDGAILFYEKAVLGFLERRFLFGHLAFVTQVSFDLGSSKLALYIHGVLSSMVITKNGFDFLS